MTEETGSSVIAADIGNSFVKFGRFAETQGPGLAEPESTMHCRARDMLRRLDQWLPSRDCWWFVSSVNRDIEKRLCRWIAAERADRYVLLDTTDVPMAIEVEFPERVGMDRLAAAVAANQLRAPGEAAVVIDAGSAITVDVVSRQGAFLGGAILPGIVMAAEALAAETDLLPLVPASYRDAPPPALGRSTEAAMRSGLYWGTVGAVKELATLLAGQIPGETRFMVSGGTAELLKDRLPAPSLHVPQLVLSGIELIARQHGERRNDFDE